MESYIGPRSTEMIQSMMQARTQSGSLMAVIIGAIAMLQQYEKCRGALFLAAARQTFLDGPVQAWPASMPRSASAEGGKPRAPIAHAATLRL